MSQQGGSSMVSSSIPNSQVKYQKALKQISKLINTNKILKAQCEERQQIVSVQLNEIAMRCQQFQKKYQESEHEKRQMKQFMQELQDTNQDLRKEYQTLERQVGYLNDVLTEQNAELKKLSVFKNQKGISELFRSYEEREDKYRREISRLEEQVSQLKTTIDRIEDDLVQQTEMRQRYEDQYNIIGLEINKYRELNNYLMDKNQHILGEQRNRGEKGGANQHEIESLVLDMKRQLESLRNLKYQNEDLNEKQYIKNYELLMQEKNNLALQLAKVKDQLAVSESRIKEMYDNQERMSTALARSDILIEENNILKNRITILESKEILDSAGFDDDSEIKVIEDKINFMMSKNDPSLTIKNGDDNSHFMKMKSFITDLQVKLQSVIEQKVSIEKKYKNIKIKFNKKAEENIILQEANKLLKGRLQGFERLTEKLNYELQRSMQAHEDEIVKMVAITNNLVGKKVQQSKTASQFIKSQFDIEIEKAERAEKSLSQQVETLRLQNGSLRLKLVDMQERQRQSTELSEIIQQKVSELTVRIKQLQKENFQLRERAIKYEQLYEQEKAFHETVVIQKQSISQQLNLLSQEVNQKSYTWQQSLKQQQDNYESQIKRSRSQIVRLSQQLLITKQDNKRVTFELEQYRLKETKNLNLFKEENIYLKDIEAKYQESKQLCHFMENQLISVKNKLAQTESLQTHSQTLETQLTKVTNELNDQKRVNIEQKNQLQTFILNNNYLKQQNEQLLNEISALKGKIYQPPTIAVSTSKDLQTRKQIQHLHQEIALLESSVRDEKRISSRYLTEIEHYKDQINRLEEIVNKNRHKQQSLQQSLSALNNQLIHAQDQLFEYKSKYNQSAASSNNLGLQVQKATQKIVEVNEQINRIKAKLSKTQTTYENLIRDLNGSKYYIQEAQKMIKRLNSVDRLEWEQQREKDNLSSLVPLYLSQIDTLNRILRNAENLQFSNTSSNQEYHFVPASSFGNFESNYNSQGSGSNFVKINFGGSFGTEEQGKTNLVTNDSFGYPGSLTSESQPNVNFSSESFGRPSQAGLSYSPYEEA